MASSWPQVKAKPLIIGAVLLGAGAMAALAGLIVGGSHLISATRQWVQDMEVPPSELAKAKWAQAKAAASAGATAWRDIPANSQAASEYPAPPTP